MISLERRATWGSIGPGAARSSFQRGTGYTGGTGCTIHTGGTGCTFTLPAMVALPARIGSPLPIPRSQHVEGRHRTQLFALSSAQLPVERPMHGVHYPQHEAPTPLQYVTPCHLRYTMQSQPCDKTTPWPHMRRKPDAVHTGQRKPPPVDKSI